LLGLVKGCKKAWGLQNTNHRIAVELESDSGNPDYILQREVVSVGDDKSGSWEDVHLFDLKTKKDELIKGESVKGWLRPLHWREKQKRERAFGTGKYKATIGFYKDCKGNPHFSVDNSDVPKGWTPGKKWRKKNMK
jgi:hypothetical protein